MNWDDTKVLLAIGRTGGLSRSAKLLGISVSTVHRKAVELEKSLNAILFSRDNDGYTLTHVGKHFFSLAEKAEEHLIAMERYNDQGQQSLFRIALPELIGQQLLQSKLTALQLKHPDLQLEMSTSVVPVDFSRREADIILRLGQLEYGLYGSKDYLASFIEHAETADDLLNHRIIGWDRSLQYTFLAQWMRELTHDAAPALSFDNMHSQLRAVIEGQGVTALPCFVAQALGLVPILSMQTLKQDVWLMRHLDTKDSDYSTLISETIEKELQEYLL
ncbi:LysR family transcriptional regulator [Acinetobacter baumannii]